MSEFTVAQRITLGLDLGTSAVKVVAIGSDDAVAGEGAADFPTMSSQPDQAEQAPSDWLRAVAAAMAALDDSMRRTRGAAWREQVAAIGLTGQLPTLVCLADSGPIAPAITWQDGRAEAWAAARVDAAHRTRMYARTGMPIDGRYLAPMLQFHFGDRRHEVRSVLSAKDYLLFALTARRLTEPSTAAGYGVYDLSERCFAKDLCEFWSLPESLLPPVQAANSAAGPLTESGAAILGLPVGIPVSTGAADSVCAAYSMAGLDERVASISFGSSAVIIGSSAAPRFDPSIRYLLTPHVTESWYGREMDLLATGTGYRWLSALFDWQNGEIDRRAAHSVPGSHGLCFPPYLASGEQGALWNPRLRGALFGLNLRHSHSDIARAYLEGVFYEVKRCVEVMAESTPIDSVIVSGNIVYSPGSMQMLADILGRTVAAVSDKSPAAIGAALLARRILGANSEPRHSSRSLPSKSPHPPAARAYATLYREYVARAALCES
jgi:xylulokinase